MDYYKDTTFRRPAYQGFSGPLHNPYFAKRFTNSSNLKSYPRQRITRYHSKLLTSFVSPSPSVDMGPDGTYVVAWNRIREDAVTIFFRRMGAGSGTAVKVVTGNQPFPVPEIGLADDGTLMVGWGRHARIFGAHDQSLTTAFQVNEQQEGLTKITSVNAGGDAGFLVTWDQTFLTPGAGRSVFTRRFASE